MNLDTHNNKAQLFINNVDSHTRNNIIKLDEKLKGLQAEIQAKLQNVVLYEEDNVEKKQSLSSVAQEIENALSSINVLVNLVSDSENPSQSELFQPENMAEFQEQLEVYLKKISYIKEQI